MKKKSCVNKRKTPISAVFQYANDCIRCKGMRSNREAAFSLCILRLTSHFQRIIWILLCYYSGSVYDDAPLVVYHIFVS